MNYEFVFDEDTSFKGLKVNGKFISYLDLKEKFKEDKEKVYAPYCPHCGSCGDTGCCSPLICDPTHIDCMYGEANVEDLKDIYREFFENEKEN